MIMLGTGFFPTFAAAAGIGELCSGSISLTDGQWARFAVDAPLIKDRLDSRYAIVGTEGRTCRIWSKEVGGLGFSSST